MNRALLIAAGLLVVGTVVFGLVRHGSGGNSACAPSKEQTSPPLPAAGDFPLSVSLEPLRVSSNGAGTYRIALANASPLRVPWACLTIVQGTYAVANRSSSHSTPERANGTVSGPVGLRESSGSTGPAYGLLIRTPRSGAAVARIVVTPGKVQGAPEQSCVVVSAAPAGAAQNATLQGSLQAVCVFPGKQSPTLLPVAVSVSGPTSVRTGRLTKYTVTVRNLGAQPVSDIGIGIAQADLQAKHFRDTVLTDWGLRSGRQSRNEVRLKTLGTAPVTFHVWWHAHAVTQSVNAATFAVGVFDRRTYPNPRELITAELSSPVTGG